VTATVVVAGGGVTGLSIALHLARAGTGVHLFAGSGAGATPASAAQVRMQHSDPYDAALAAASRPVFADWAARIGGDCGYRACGFALLVGPGERDAATRGARLLARLGVAVRTCRPAEHAGEHPGLNLAGVGAVFVEPQSGYADPSATVAALRRAAVRCGVRITGDEVDAVHVRHGRVTGVRTGDDVTAAGAVVLAAGTGSTALARTAGVDLPLAERRIGWGVARLDRPWAAPTVVIDDVLGAYFRPVSSTEVLFGVPLEASPASDAARVAGAAARIGARLPGLRTARVAMGASAREAYTPDRHALIGPAGPDGLYLATGFSGGGFKVAPAVGAAVADEISTGRTVAELAPYRPDRFDRRKPIRPVFEYRNM
jgi:glycine/D-amino acid oxidase-like deaminating enzyme